MEGFIYPNEVVIDWGLLVVLYPYITGLVAGAFIVSSLYHVFGLTKLKSVSRFSLLTALAFLLVCAVPLLFDVGRPERALEIFLRPNLLSAMSVFGYIWLLYLLLVMVEVWLVFRPDIVRYATSSEGIRKTFYSILALGIYDVSQKALEADKKLIKLLALIGVPSACLLHGYVGFIFGAIKANAWWSTPLMPIIFLLSAIVSGIALQIVLYTVITKIRKASLDYECLRSLSLWLGGFLTMAFALEGLEVVTMLYESEETWGIISQLITEKIVVTYLGVQFILGALVPLLLIGVAELTRLGVRGKMYLSLVASALVLVGVFAMRWNVVIGGQLMSKSLRGFTSYSPSIFGLDGVFVTVVLMVLPFVILAAITYLMPPWPAEIPVETAKVRSLRG